MMFRFLFAVGLVLSASLASAQNSEGAAFANGFVPTAPGQVVNPAAVNSQAWSGQTNLSTNNIAGTGAFTQPNTNSSQFSSGQYSGSLSNFGNKAMIDCANYVPTGNVTQDQYCAGVNYLTNNCIQPNSTQKSILSNAGVVRNAAGNCSGTYGTGIAQSYQISGNDANLANAFATSAKNNSGVSGGCQILTVNTPAQYKTYDCVQSYYSTANTCTYDLNPQCLFAGSEITSMTTSGPTSVIQSSPGLYSYSISCGWGGGGTCYGSITFNLDAPSQGAYMTANSSSLDDTAVIAVNGIVVFYGHPNSGGSWYYPTFGTTAQFVWGYQDTLYQQQCVSYDWESGGCNAYDNVAVATSQYKLSDSCPISGDYSNKTGSQATWCTADGKLVGRIVEGNYYGGISVNGKLPLQAGQNTIQMFGGTEGGPYSGGITLTGQIYNVAPICSSLWTDNCTALETSAGSTIGTPQ